MAEIQSFEAKFECFCFCGVKLVNTMIGQLLKCYRNCGGRHNLPCCYIRQPNQCAEALFLIGISAPIIAVLTGVYPAKDVDKKHNKNNIINNNDNSEVDVEIETSL